MITPETLTSPTPTPSGWRGMFTAHVELRAAVVAGALLLVGAILHTAMGIAWAEGFVYASLAIGCVYGGRPALQALRERRFDIDVLMIVAAVMAAVLRHPEEGALLLFLFVLAGALEDLAMARTKREVEALHRLMPTSAVVWRDGNWREAAAESLVPGERVKIRPGEAVPADAEVTVGETAFDQSAITGESMPRSVKPGDELYAGTINTDDPVEARVLRRVSESSLQKILDLVTRAKEQREPVQRLIDRLDQPYAISVMVVSIATFFVWWKVFGFPVFDSGEQRGALYVAITLLIVASPCAVIIATPTATLAGIARAARSGVLFKGGQAIEQLARTTAICFDKTGTLTFGRPKLYEVHPVGWSDGAELLGVAAALEADSTHPIAVAVREAADARAVRPALVEGISHEVAKGIEGTYQGVRVRLGRYSFCEEFIPACFRARVQEILAKIQDRGHVAIVIAKSGDEGGAGVLIMADAVRPGAKALSDELHKLNIRPVRMLTGDNHTTARRIGEGLGIDKVDADLLPGDKLRIVTEMKAETPARGGVAFIGDGVNDAPALAAATVAMAMGTIGTAAALESADVVLLSDSLAGVPWSIRLARRVRRTIALNFTFALTIIGLMGTATLVGSLIGTPVPMAIGVLAHEGGTLLVVLNSLFLLGFAGPDGSVQGPMVSARARAGTPQAA